MVYLKKPSFIVLSTCLIFSSIVLINSARAKSITLDGEKIHLDPVTGKTRLIAIKNKKPIQNDKNNISHKITEKYSKKFGISNPEKNIKLRKRTFHTSQDTTYRYQQHYKNIPVIGAELVAGVDKKNQLRFISGETSPNLLLDVSEKITREQAVSIAKQAVAKWYRLSIKVLVDREAELSIFEPKLITPNTKPATLVWRINITADNINELVMVDALTGAISFHARQIYSALNRETYSANNTRNYQSQLICDESDPDCSAGDDEAKAAHKYAEDTYLYYLNTHGRDGIDGVGGTIVTSVNVGTGFGNAAWTGNEVILGAGFAQADDVVAHELTHGVTENTSNLFYYYQSGAINESLSDLWGEFVDQSNSLDALSGTDTDDVKWIIGEDIPGDDIIRDMKNPPSKDGPDKMTSENYYTGTTDFGGVHKNSGVNNKAVYLMTDGDNFNGQTITGIGMDKVAKLYYEVQTKHLTSGSDYLDLYNALIQACSDLISDGVMDANDCTQVEAALNAVEMNQQPVNAFNIEASLCPAQSVQSTIIFNDDIESGVSNWQFSHDTQLASNNWLDVFEASSTTPYATSGLHSLIAFNIDRTSDAYAQIDISLPLISADENIFLHFKHAVDLEGKELPTRNDYFDAGVVEYSLNNGASWNDAMDFIVDGKSYTGKIGSRYANPLAGRLAYSAISNGFVSTRLKLSDFSGQSIRLRWRMATDSSVASLGWVIDDVSIYNCQGSSASSPRANAGVDRTINSKANIILDGSASFDNEAAIVSYVWEQVGGKQVILNNTSSVNPNFTAPAGNDVLAFKLTVTDSDGVTDTDIVNVIIDTTPTANAGNDFSTPINSTTQLNALTSSDVDGSIANYRWEQLEGDTVILDNVNSPQAQFTAPSSPQTLIFKLIVTDNDGIESEEDIIKVSVIVSGGGGGGCSLAVGKRKFDPFMLFLLLGLTILHLSRKYFFKE